MGGTEAFPDLGKHCEMSDCRQLDFLPFNCDGCKKTFCLEHRSYKEHRCPKAEHKSRVVIICEVCTMAIEKKKADEEESDVFRQHRESGKCDASKKYKPMCPVKRCKERLTFSNTNTCKICNQKVCLKHRFPSDHVCIKAAMKESKFLIALASRSGSGCRGNNNSNKATSPRSIEAC